MLKKIWHDPVWSKVISAGIIAIGAAVGSYLIGWWPIIGQWLVSESKIPKWLLVLLFTTVPVFVASGTWIASGNIRVEPRDRDIENLKEQVAERDKTISKLEAARGPDRTKIDELSATNQKLGNELEVYKVSCKQWQDSLEGWKTQNSELKKQLNTYATNCSVISEIRTLDKRKSTIDTKIFARASRTDLFADALSKGLEDLKHESNDLQSRMLVLQQRLACEPK